MKILLERIMFTIKCNQMKQTMKHLHRGLALFLAMFATLRANQGWAQSTPQQVKGSNWEALTEAAPAVAMDGSTKYMAWQGSNSSEIYFSTLTNGAWTKPTIVVWKAGSRIATCETVAAREA